MSKFDKDSLGNRMKGYETISRRSLMPKLPVIIRIDGKAFHTYTKAFPSRFFYPMHAAFLWAAKEMAQDHLQGCKLVYTQSDEISFLLTDWDKRTTSPWFDYTQNKLESVAASLFTGIYNKYARELFVPDDRVAFFDARAFNLPVHEVVNYFIWRQQDATRNSVLSTGYDYFSHKQLHGKKVHDVMDMLMLEKGVNWNDKPTWSKRGSCVRLTRTESEDGKQKRFVVDEEIPIFTQDRGYVHDLLTDFVEAPELKGRFTLPTHEENMEFNKVALELAERERNGQS